MCVPVRVALLALLMLGSSAASEHVRCNLREKATKEDMHKISESRWILVKGFSNFTAGQEQLRAASSSIVEISPSSDSNTFQFEERNIVNNVCLTYYTNMTIPDPRVSEHSLVMDFPGVEDSNGAVSLIDDKTKIDVYQTGPDSVVMIYYTVVNGTPGQMVLSYRREGKQQNTEELTTNEKLTECLGFTLPPHFIYDGEAGFCKKKKDSGA